jgi:hypothetical protein
VARGGAVIRNMSADEMRGHDDRQDRRDTGGGASTIAAGSRAILPLR